MMEGRDVAAKPARRRRLGSSPSLARRIVIWLDERIGFTALLPFLRKKVVPIHRHSFWYYLGGMALFLFGLQIVTGILLLFYYRPNADGAYESVQFLMSEVRFGWLIRSIHSWGANLMIFMAFVHLFSVMLLKAYRKPRELTWMTGVGLLFVILGLGFTGYLLHQTHAVIEVAFDLQHDCTVCNSLSQLAHRNLAFRDQHEGSHAGSGCISGGGGGSIAGRRTDNGLGTLLCRLTDSHGHASILE